MIKIWCLKKRNNKNLKMLHLYLSFLTDTELFFFRNRRHRKPDAGKVRVVLLEAGLRLVRQPGHQGLEEGPQGVRPLGPGA